MIAVAETHDNICQLVEDALYDISHGWVGLIYVLMLYILMLLPSLMIASSLSHKLN
jgi:hypothetical protein